MNSVSFCSKVRSFGAVLVDEFFIEIGAAPLTFAPSTTFSCSSSLEPENEGVLSELRS